MQKISFFLICCFLIYSCCWAQREDNVWIFGDSLGLDLNSGNPFLINSNINTPKPYITGSASIADVNGQLLFYSNANKIWNRNHNTMPNGQLNNQPVSAWQNSIIVPYPENPGKYFLFTINGVFNNIGGIIYLVSTKLEYSVIDMNLNGGLGDVVTGQNSIAIDTGLSGGLTAIPGNRCNIWLVTRKLNEYHSFEITANGVQTTPVVSSFVDLPPRPTRSSINIVNSILKFSSDGTKMAANTETNERDLTNLSIKLYNFDKTTGKLSNQKIISTGAYYLRDITFSPDGSKIYTTGTPYSCILCDEILQFDLSLPSLNAIIASKTRLTPLWGGGVWVGIKMANNGKVYATGPELSAFYIGQSSDSLGIYEITQPNLAGIACGFNPVPVLPSIPGGASIFSNEVFGFHYDSLFQVTLDTTICTQNNYFPDVELKAPTGHYQFTWDDGSKDTTRQIERPGIYWVIYRENCNTITDTFIVRQKDISLSLGNDTILCLSSSIDLQVTLPNATALWQDFSSGSTYTVTRDGKYWVTVTQDGCKASDSINITIKNIAQDLGPDTIICHGIPIQVPLQARTTPQSTALWSNGSSTGSVVANDTGKWWVKVTDLPCVESDTIYIRNIYCGCNFIVPNVFSPNGDGINDIFLPQIETGCPVNDYMLNIYNRFGQRIFSSSNSTKGWDGNHNRTPADAGTYFYELRFRGGSDQTENYHRGDVILIR